MPLAGGNSERLDAKQLVTALAENGFSSYDELRSAYAIVQRESSGYVYAINYNTNGTTDYGLFQINEVNFNFLGVNIYVNDIFKPSYNIKMAKKLFDAYGWSSWGVPNLDGSVTGWAKTIKEKYPDIYKSFVDKYEEGLIKFDKLMLDPDFKDHVNKLTGGIKRSATKGFLAFGVPLLLLGVVGSMANEAHKN